MSQAVSDDEIIRRTKKVIEDFLSSHNGQYPTSIDDILLVPLVINSKRVCVPIAQPYKTIEGA